MLDLVLRTAETSAETASAGSAVVSVITSIITLVSMWKIFDKAGEGGWKSIVPLYNVYTLFKIGYGEGWKALLLLIPIVNIYFGVMCYVKLAKSFGMSGWFGIAMIIVPFVFMPMLAFGAAQYCGPEY